GPQPTPALPPAQAADVPVPDDVLPGPPAPAPTSAPAPDGMASALPEAAQAAPPPLLVPDSPASPGLSAALPAPPATARQPSLAFAPEAAPAETPAPAPADVVPLPPAPPSVRLEAPLGPEPPQQEAMIMPRPPPPLPPMEARPRPTPRPAPGTFANPLDLDFGPSAPRPAAGARSRVASRAIDLSLGPPRQGPLRSDPYADIRAANASADWNRGLMAYWLRHRYYPQQAVENGEDGTVVIELTVNRSGHVEAVDVKSRSGSQWLDMAAVGTFRSGNLPPFTPEMRDDRITFTIPIHYILIR
ncbi:MAG: energy transducer TonB, partial [Acetobacteraceae bacterium]|nr:energy transducer TonB [Acetobacteraceae bacterium]